MPTEWVGDVGRAERGVFKETPKWNWKLQAIIIYWSLYISLYIRVLHSAVAYVEELPVLKCVNVGQMSLMTISFIMKQIYSLSRRLIEH